MQGMNVWVGAGNLGKDPEVKYAQSGVAICDLSLAVNERRKDGDGWKDHVEWVTVTVFGKTAEACGQHLSKGSGVMVKGRLETQSWDDKATGEKKYRTKVIAEQVTFAGSKEGGAESRPTRTRKTPEKPAQAAETGFVDDDLPFMRWEPTTW